MYFINLKCALTATNVNKDTNKIKRILITRFIIGSMRGQIFLYYFNEAVFGVIDVLTLDFYLNGIQKAVHNSLLKLNYLDWEMFGINTKSHIEGIIRSVESVVWCYNHLLRSLS